MNFSTKFKQTNYGKPAGVSSHFMETRAYIALILLLIISCSPPENKTQVGAVSKKWSEDSIKKYFKDSVAHRLYNGRLGEGDSLNDFDKFAKNILTDIKAKNITDPFILGFDESYIDTTKLDKQKKWFRVSVDPCFRIPYCLILEQTNGKSILTLKMTDGHGGYYSGFLNFVSSQEDSIGLYTGISKKLNQLNFWQLELDSSCKGGLDGESWTFEALENGNYNIVSRWVPLRCGNSITKQLAQIAVELRNRALFKNFIQAKTGMTKKEIEAWYPD